jgi:hypothetical protein
VPRNFDKLTIALRTLPLVVTGMAEMLLGFSKQS